VSATGPEWLSWYLCSFSEQAGIQYLPHERDARRWSTPLLARGLDDDIQEFVTAVLSTWNKHSISHYGTEVDDGTIKRKDWDDLFGDYTATLDYPAAMFPRRHAI
jgi:hypothetical protein